jgi:hypothetical protein
MVSIGIFVWSMNSSSRSPVSGVSPSSPRMIPATTSMP